MNPLPINYPSGLKLLLSCLFFAFIFAACSTNSSSDDDNNNEPPPASTTDVQITIDNVGATAWEITDIQGDENAATQNENNTTITFEENLRYRFINNGGSAHPFGLQDVNSAYLLAQGDRDGSFEADAEVDFESDNEGITFTLTPALAAELNTYNCQIHAAMEGSVSIR